MSSYFEQRQLIAQGLRPKEGKKAPCKKIIIADTGIITLDQWFLDRRKELTGKCMHCGGSTPKFDDFSYKSCIAHILPKRPGMFPSVATHPLNWIELCSWGNNCHGNLDAGTLDLMDLHCFNLVIERFIIIYPDIAPKERRNIPDLLLQYIQSNS